MDFRDRIRAPVNRVNDRLGETATLYNYTKTWDADDAEYDWTASDGVDVKAEFVQTEDPRTLTDIDGAGVESDVEIVMRSDLDEPIRGAGVEEEHPSEIERASGRRYRVLTTHETMAGRLKCWAVVV